MPPRPKNINFLEIDYGLPIQYPVGMDIVDAAKYVKVAALRFNEIEEYQGKVINILCRGSSGAILAALFAFFINNERKNILHFKKDGEGCHGSSTPRVPFGRINVIIDDFIDTGSTINTIYKKAGHMDIHCLIVDKGYDRDTIDFKPDYLISRIYRH